jgi:hypothetical protein
MSSHPSRKRTSKSPSFRVGQVTAFLRGRVWYLRYHEHGRRHQPRVGADRDATRQMAAEINAQLEVSGNCLALPACRVPCRRLLTATGGAFFLNGRLLPACCLSCCWPWQHCCLRDCIFEVA